MMVPVLLLLGIIIPYTAADKFISVSHSECTSMNNIDVDQTVSLSYQGAGIKWCQHVIYTEKSDLDLCVIPTSAEIGCSISVQYSGGTYYPGSPDMDYTCSVKPDSEWCTSRGVLYVTFVQNGTDIASNVKLTVFSKTGTGETTTDRALITGIAVGCTVFVLAVLTSVAYCCFVRKFSTNKRHHRNRHKPKAVPTDDFQMSGR